MLFFLFMLFPFAIMAEPLPTTCPELTVLQKAAGYITWLNILRIFSIGVGVFSFCFLFRTWVVRFIKLFANIPKEAYEVLAYIGSVALIITGLFVSHHNALWFGLTGSLLFAGALIFTAFLHDIEKNEVRFFSILFGVWSVVAVSYQSSVIGFIAIGALMGLVGFSLWVTPLCYAFGFKDKDALGNATSTGFAILLLFLFLRMTHVAIPFMDVFESGAYWLGSFVMFLGLLIASTKWYGNNFPYVLMQVITIVAGMLALYIGSVFDIAPLRSIGGTFFALYLIEKPFEIPAESATGYAVIGLLVSIGIGTGVWWAQNHPDIVAPYLLF